MIKITKKNIIKSFSEKLEILGYTFLEDDCKIANGLFYKKINPDLILTLGFTISSYSNRFTADFYLSRTFAFGYMLRDFPKNAYQRISYFLHDNERAEILKNTNWAEIGVKDAWWDNLESESINNFLEILNISENRFLNQENLVENIYSSKELNEFINLLRETTDSLSLIDSDKHYKFLPIKNTENVPLEWFKSAEVVLTKYLPKLVRETYVKLVGINAWRLYNLK